MKKAVAIAVEVAVCVAKIVKEIVKKISEINKNGIIPFSLV